MDRDERRGAEVGLGVGLSGLALRLFLSPSFIVAGQFMQTRRFHHVGFDIGRYAARPCPCPQVVLAVHGRQSRRENTCSSPSSSSAWRSSETMWNGLYLRGLAATARFVIYGNASTVRRKAT